jgi:hypothetical protein
MSGKSTWNSVETLDISVSFEEVQHASFVFSSRVVGKIQGHQMMVKVFNSSLFIGHGGGN